MASQLLQRVMQMPLIPAQMQQPVSRPAMASPQRPGSSLLARLHTDLSQAKRAGMVGADGRKDTVIAQINPHEAAILKMLGGAGTINPRTGLRQFGEDGNPGNSEGGSSNARNGGSSGPSNGSNGGGHAMSITHDYNTNAYTGNDPAQHETGQTTNAGLKVTDQTTDYGAPVRVSPDTGVATALNPNQWSNWSNQVNTYNQAAKAWNTSASTPSIANLINAMQPMGLSMEAPDLNRPATYTAGTYHLGINPAAAVAGVLGSALGPLGTGTLAGAAAGGLYSAFGGENPVLSGPPQPAGWDPNGAAPFSPSRPNSAAPAANLGNPYGGSNPQPVLPGAAVPLPPIPGAPGTPSGSTLPPTTVPASATVPGGNFQIPGPLPYGYVLPSWAYQPR